MADAPNTHTTGRRPPRKKARWLGFLIGVALLGGAAIALANNGGDFADAMSAMRHAHWWQWLALPGSMLGSLVLTSAVFWIFSKQYGDVGYAEMNGLIGIAWVMNYLPMHPGMFGRVAYHKAVNGIAVRDSMRVLISANVQSLLAIAALPVIAYVCVALLGLSEPATFALLQIPAIACFAAAAVLAKRAASDAHAWRFWACLGIRCVEIELWALRYWLSFAVIGLPIEFSAAVLIAGVVIIASMVAITGNGMGIQEWAVGLVAPLLPAAIVAAEIAQADGLIGAFLSRSVEVLVAIPCGLWGVWYVRRLARRKKTLEP